MIFASFLGLPQSQLELARRRRWDTGRFSIERFNQNVLTILAWVRTSHHLRPLPTTTAYYHPNIQTSRHPDIQTSRLPDFQTSRYPDIQTSKHPDIQTSRHPDIQGLNTKQRPRTVASRSAGYPEDFAIISKRRRWHISITGGTEEV